jgi:hypothetical protein
MADMRESNGTRIPQEGNGPRIGDTKPPRSVGALTVEIDCSDALKGLKAVTREAKKATAALKELEEQQAKMNVQVQIDCGSKGIAKELFEQMQRARARGASI